MSRQRPGHTLQTTALVTRPSCASSTSGVRVAGPGALHRRRGPGDAPHRRRPRAAKQSASKAGLARRQGGARRGGLFYRTGRAAELVALDEALQGLAELHARKSRVVELRHFGGLTTGEAAEVLGVSEANTVSAIGGSPGRGSTASYEQGECDGPRTHGENRRSSAALAWRRAHEEPPSSARLARAMGAAAGGRVISSAHGRAGGFMERPVSEEAAHLMVGGGAAAARRPDDQTFYNSQAAGRRRDGRNLLGRDARLDRPVALKLLPVRLTADYDQGHRFRREALAASALNHPNILTVHEVGEREGRPSSPPSTSRG